MKVNPRYDGPPILVVPFQPGEVLLALTRQRRRMYDMLAALTDDQWQAQSRCAQWKVLDVVTHLSGVNPFWVYTVKAGLSGRPSRVLASFDPAATPASMVASAGATSPADALETFRVTNEALFAVMEGLADDDWALAAECPAGHVTIGCIAAHALWDAWVHERDIALPLGLPGALEADELSVCLRYAATLGPALGLNVGGSSKGSFALNATDPTVEFTLSVGESVVLRNGLDPAAPTLSGSAVDLLEAISVRAPMPSTAPSEWHTAIHGIAAAFDTPGPV